MDGQDTEWRRRREQAEKAYYGADACRFSNVEGRFRDNDELRYSLRSLMPHLDCFGQIFIVTDRQTPRWLAPHSRITMIDHADLRDMNRGATFSSKALEACFDRLPTTQDIVYLNDDVFLGAGFLLQHFFDPLLEKAVVHFEKEEDQDPLHDVSQNTAMHVSHNILKALFDPQHFRFNPMGHAPRYLIRADLAEAFDCFPEALEQARTEIFRESTRPSFTADLYPRWLLANGRAIEKPVAHMLLSSGAPVIAQQLGELIRNFNQLSFFCINDTLDNTPNSHDVFRLIRSTLQQLFPEPSEFELGHAVENYMPDDNYARRSIDS